MTEDDDMGGGSLSEVWSRGLNERMQTDGALRDRAAFYVTAYRDSKSSAARATSALLDRGEYTPQLMFDLACQPFRRRPGLDHGATAVLLNSYIQSGRVVVVPLGPIESPGADKETEGNNKKIEAALSDFDGLFEAKFLGGYGDSDGHFQWTQPIRASSVEAQGRAERVLEIGPRSIPLEVGTAQIHSPLFHLRRSFGVARWPYGYEVMFVLVRVCQTLEDDELLSDVSVVG